MSSTMQVSGGGAVGNVFTFSTAKTDKGFVLDQSARDEEELVTPGVDGRRWRSKGLQHDVFTVETVAGTATFNDAIILAKQHRSAKGRNVSLTLDAGNGVTVPFQNIHVKDVTAVPTPGALTGAGVSGGINAHVVTTWTLVPTSFGASDNVAT